jgi:maleylacetoacetate isomerase
MQLFSYFRSSAAYRLRIALALKGLDYDYVAVNLLKSEQTEDRYRSLNPIGLLPALRLDSHEVLSQSVAILEWLEEQYSSPALLPTDAISRAKVRALVNIIACDIHPICNLSVTNHLKTEFGADQNAIVNWYGRWMSRGFEALETLAASTQGTFCIGDSVSLADVCLIPQLYNANRFGIELEPYPTLAAINMHCLSLEAFQMAGPEQQPDYRESGASAGDRLSKTNRDGQ